MSKTFIKDGHTDKILHKLWKNSENENLCDVVLIAGTVAKRIPAHRLVLSEASEYFNEIFISSLRECTFREVEMPNVNGDVLKSLIEFCYKGCVVINDNIAVELLKTAEMLRLRDVVQACGNFLVEQLRPDNYLQLTLLAEQYQCELLLQKTKEFSLKNFIEISKTKEFLKLNANKLTQLLACDNLQVVAEEDVFNSLKKWLEHDPIEREQYKVEMLKLVRMPLMKRSFLIEQVSPICTSVECLRIYMKALEMVISSDSFETSGGNLTKPRKPYTFLMGITINKSIDKTFIHYYCPWRQKWLKCLKELEYRVAFAEVSMKNCLYIIGGFDAKKNVLNTVISLNLNSMTFTEIAPMNQNRGHSQAAALNGVLYAVGGQNGRTLMNSVEKWNPETNKWYNVAPMGVNRCNFGNAVLNEKIFAVGGISNGKPVSSVECYDPVQDVWQNIAPMRENRELPGIAVINGMLYAVGGVGVKTAERYNPQTNEWTSICSLRGELFPFRSCTALNDKIVISCKDGFDEYDPEKNEWKAMKSVKYSNNFRWIFSYSEKLLASQFAEM